MAQTVQLAQQARWVQREPQVHKVRWDCRAQGIQGPPGSLSGTGTANFLPLFSTGTTVANSNVLQSTSGTTAGDVGIGTSTPAATLDVNGTINAANQINIGGQIFAFGTPFLLGNGSTPDSGANAYIGFAGSSNAKGLLNTAGDGERSAILQSEVTTQRSVTAH